MEDLGTAAQAGHFFGPSSPMNWGKDLVALTVGKGFDVALLGVPHVTHMAVNLAARLHARFWQNMELASLSWLRGSGWISGQDRDAWLASQAEIREAWSGARLQIEASGVQWDPLVVACV